MNKNIEEASDIFEKSILMTNKYLKKHLVQGEIT